MEASSTPGTAARKAPRLAWLRAWPALTAGADGGLEAGVERLVDQGVTDGDFEHPGDRGQEGAEVGLAEVVAGVDAEPGGLRRAGGGGAGARGIGFAAREGLGERTGVELHA